MNSSFSGFPELKSNSVTEDPYYKMANTVMKTILTGIGKSDLTLPKLNIINSTRDVAYTNKKTGIHVSTKFIDLCRTFGADSLSALSVVMAHELGHYFKDHFFCADFGYAYAETEWADSIKGRFKDIYQSGYFETQADEFGLFYSFVSGYDPFKVADQVIAKIYDEFDLPEEMDGYPPKDFRIEQIGIAKSNVQKLIPLFEVGNIMTVLASGKMSGTSNDLIDNANSCYKHIISQKVTTAEMYNNLGVNYVNKALGLMEKDAFKYALPVEVDFNSRIYNTLDGTKNPGNGSNLGFGKNETEILEYLTQAKKYFEEAIQLDAQYIPGYNNLGAAFFILKEYDEAWVKVNKGRKLAKELDSPIQYLNSIDLLALIQYHNDEKKEAEELWREALSKGSLIAKYNIQMTADQYLTTVAFKDVFKNVTTTTTLSANQPQYVKPKYTEIEKVNGKALSNIGNEYIHEGKAIDTWELADKKAMVGKTQYQEGELIIFAALDRGYIKDSYFFYFYPNTGNALTSLQISNGNTKEQVIAAYGQPVNIISSEKHNYWVYYNKNIIFKMNDKNVVDGYIIYDVNL
jgi:hypothetical protein